MYVGTLHEWRHRFGRSKPKSDIAVWIIQRHRGAEANEPSHGFWRSRRRLWSATLADPARALAMAPVSSSVRHQPKPLQTLVRLEQGSRTLYTARLPGTSALVGRALRRRTSGEAHRPAAPQALDVSSRGIDVRDSAPGLLASTASPSYCASMKEHPRSAAIRKRPSEARRGAIQKRNACCPNRFQPPRHACRIARLRPHARRETQHQPCNQRGRSDREPLVC